MKKTIALFTIALNVTSFGQVAVEPGDLIIFDLFDSYSLIHVDRDTSVRTRITGQGYDPEDESNALLFQNTREIHQHTDGNFYIGNAPYDHIIKVDTRYSRGESKNRKALYPDDVFGFNLNEDSHAMSAEGILYRIGYKRVNGIWISGIIAHNLNTDDAYLLTSGNYFTSGANVAAIDMDANGNLIAVQDNNGANVVLVDTENGSQQLIGGSPLLSGRVTDVEVLSSGALAIAAGNSGLLIAEYTQLPGEPVTFSLNISSYNPPGGFCYRVKEDIDGMPVASSDFSQNRYYADKLDLNSGTFSQVYHDVGVSFEIAKHRVTLNPRVELLSYIEQTGGGSFGGGGEGETRVRYEIEYFGKILKSNDLTSWEEMSPQPSSPFILDMIEAQAFYKVEESQ
jgi:hypothetical protein